MHGSKAGSLLRALHRVQLVHQVVPLPPARRGSMAARLLGVRGARAHHSSSRRGGGGGGCGAHAGAGSSTGEARSGASSSSRVREAGGGGANGLTARGATRVVALGEGGGSCGAGAAEGASDGLGLALEGVGVLLAAGQVAALALEVLHGDGGQLGGAVVLGLVLVHLVDGDGGVDDGGLDGLLLHDGLDDLVHVVVDVLARDGWARDGRVLYLGDMLGVLELGRLSCQALLHLIWVAVLEAAVLDGGHSIDMLLWEQLAILNGLDRGVVVVLVHLAVDGCLQLISLGADHLLMLHSRLDDLDSGSALVNWHAGCGFSPRGQLCCASHP